MERKKLIRIEELLELTGQSRSGLYGKIAKNEFPRPVSLGVRAKAWVLGEVIDWIEAAIARRDADQITSQEMA